MNHNHMAGILMYMFSDDVYTHVYRFLYIYIFTMNNNPDKIDLGHAPHGSHFFLNSTAHCWSLYSVRPALYWAI